MQQDAHEFLNFLINHINEIILGEYFFVIYFWNRMRQKNNNYFQTPVPYIHIHSAITSAT